MKKTFKKSILWLLATCVAAACTNKSVVYHSYHTLSHEGWGKSDTLFFHIPMNDSVPTTLRLYAEIRNKTSYPYHNLHLLISHNLTDTARWQTDTIAFQLADSTGKWTGKGWGGIYQSEQLICSLPSNCQGNYTMKVISNMKDSYLPGISNVGVRIEKE